jgi:hypothetical protein
MFPRSEHSVKVLFRPPLAQDLALGLDTSSPLYGVADPALFVHDEFILECDEHAAEAALKEQERLMARGMAAVCRTPVKAEGKILRERWTK